jgi:hypothetical protein
MGWRADIRKRIIEVYYSEGFKMNLKLLVEELTDEALEFMLVDAFKRGDNENARIISDEQFERMLRNEAH